MAATYIDKIKLPGQTTGLPLKDSSAIHTTDVGDGLTLNSSTVKVSANVQSVNGQTGAVTIASGTKIVASSTEPTDLNTGDFWFKIV